MKVTTRFSLRSLPALAVLACVLVGCSSSPVVVEISDNEKHMKRIAVLYGDYRRAKGTSPKNTAELKAWVKSLPKADLERRGIDAVDQVFISPRDSQEYVIVPTPKNAMMGMSKVIAYEKTGVEGKRWKINTQSYINEVTEAELDQVLKEIGQKR